MPIVAELRFAAPDLFLGDASRAAPDVAVPFDHDGVPVEVYGDGTVRIVTGTAD